MYSRQHTPVSRRLLFLITEDWFFAGHLLDLAKAVKSAGYEVAVATRLRKHRERILAAGLEAISIEFDRTGRNPLIDIATIARIAAVYREYRPDIVHQVAIKPIIYGTLAARLTGIHRIVNAITGLGYVFTSDDWFARRTRSIVAAGYRRALSRGHTILQNDDDLALLHEMGLLTREAASVVHGVGVDLETFCPTDEPPGPPVVVLASRMLREKGITEFVDAARIVREAGHDVRFKLVGQPDAANPSAVPESELRAWHDSGVVEWVGWIDDMPALYESAHIVCLPSYREGLPKTLLEAAAAARPIVTTDAPGCRDAVRPNVTGLVVPPRDSRALAAALTALVTDRDRRVEMGRRGRQLAVDRFSIERVSAQTLAIYDRVYAETPQSVVRLRRPASIRAEGSGR